MLNKNVAASVAAVLLVVGCVTAPYTGRGQLMLVSESNEIESGEEAYRDIMRDSVLADNSDALRIVRKVGERIARAANKPEYRWEFRVINDPEDINAFCVPGGKVAVYTGIFPVAKDEAGLAVILGHEVAHALLRHSGERMTQTQILGTGLALAGAGGVNPQILQALGLGASVGVVLPFSRSQESEADHVGLMLMAKAGYDPRVSLDVWNRMERKEKGGTPDFLSTHPGSETRIQQLKAWMPEALQYYQPGDRVVELLPSPQSLDSPTARSERELLKRIQVINQFVEQQNGERAVAEALAYELRLNLPTIVNERQQLKVGYGQYAALRGLAYLGRGSVRNIVAEYQRGGSWSTIAQNNASGLNELTAWITNLMRTTNTVARQLRTQPYRSSPRMP
jgi:predicted Zn-dependent protease